MITLKEALKEETLRSLAKRLDVDPSTIHRLRDVGIIYGNEIYRPLRAK